MSKQRLAVLGRRRRGPAAFSLFLLFAAAAQAAPPPPEETVPVGESRERSIAAGEAQAWKVMVPPDTTVLVTVEQRSIDLVVEARGPGDKEPYAVTASRDSWGTEVLLLDRAGENRIEVRSRDKSAWPGRYNFRIEDLPERTGARHDALVLMSRAGRETLPDTQESRKQAEATYRQALAAWRVLGNRDWKAEALTSIGILEAEASDFLPASGDLSAALQIWRELGEPRRETDALSWLGSAYSKTEGAEKARETWETVRSQWRALAEPFEEAQTHANLCNLLLKGGDLTATVACNQETLEFFHEHKIVTLEAEILNRMGGVYDHQGEPDDALANYQKALALWSALGDRKKEAMVLNNMAIIHRLLGEWQEALRLYDEAREVVAPFGDRLTEASLLNNIGFLYNGAEEPQWALKDLFEALKIRREMGDRAEEITTLNNLGIAWRKLGDLKKALDHHQQALALAKSQGDLPQEAVSLVQLAEVHLDGGDPAAALHDLDAAFLALAGKTNRTEMEARHLQGKALVAAGRAQEALPVLRAALVRRQKLRDRAGEAETLYVLAVAERTLGLAADSLTHAEQAVDRAEVLRTGFFSPELRASFLSARRKSFSLLIDLLMDRNTAEPGKGHDREAFAISERARARGLLDVLRAGSNGSATSSATPELVAKRSALLRRLSAKVDQRWRQSGARAEALEKEIDSIVADVDATEAEIRRQDHRFAAFSAPKPVSPDEISRGLEPGTALLEYSLGDDRSFMWVLDSEGLRSFVLPGQRKIEDLARRVYEGMSTVGSRSAQSDAADLARLLLGPLWTASEAKPIRRLVVVPDGALALLPFAALPVPAPGKAWTSSAPLLPLVEHVEIVSIPSATTLAVQRQLFAHRAEAPNWAAVFADPVFGADDPRLNRAAARPRPERKAVGKATESTLRGADTRGPLVLERLPATRSEAEDLAALAPAGKVKLDLGLAASRDAALARDLRDYRIVHFATHAVADTQNPELSGLMLSQVDAQGQPREGFLGLSDIYELDLDADLVVLSGCKTAVGKEVRGEGLMGLTRGFQYAGVPRVVASLWKVQDRATAELMTAFYRAMWRDHLPPAAALRAAQRSLRRDPRYRNPYSWAGFVLQGDWN